MSEEVEISDSQEQCLFIRKEIESTNDEDDWDDTLLIKECDRAIEKAKGQVCSMYDEDDWDDTLLTKEYDRAIEKAKGQVIGKIQAEMELPNAEIQEVFSDTKSKSSNFTKSKKDKAKKSKKNKQSWTVGSACRAIYSEDGDEYEAEIVQLLQQNKCIVNFIGYNNQEEVCLGGLTPSLGKHAIDIQIMAANIDQAASEESNDNKVPTQNMANGWNSFDPRQMSSIQRPSMVHIIPPTPPPPFPPSMGHHSFKNHGVPVNDDEALNSLLMSWYMCGYYSGYYERAMKN